MVPAISKVGGDASHGFYRVVEPIVSKLEFWSRLRSGSQNFGLDFDLSLKSLVTVLFSVSDVQS